MAQWFAITAGVIVLAGAPPYLIDILKGRTKPERATWFIWSVLGVIAFVSQASLHGGWSLVLLGFGAFGSITVFLLSLKFGTAGWTKLDKWALVIAAIGVSVALFAHRPVVALIGVVLADAAGTVLTVKKTFHKPHSETTITWFFAGTAALLGAMSVGKWELDLLIYPVYLAVGNYAVLAAKYAGLANKYTRVISQADQS